LFCIDHPFYLRFLLKPNHWYHRTTLQGLGLISKVNASLTKDFDIAQWQVPLLRTLCGESALPDKNKELTPLLINDDSLLSGSRR
jgi:hypothetical protein